MKVRSLFLRLMSLTVLIGALLATACTSNTPSQESQSSTVSTKPEGSLTISISFARNSIDPVNSPNTFQALTNGVYDSLIEITTEGKTRPGLAERWEISPDGKTHTFYIRKGVKFHDGTDLTGADVKFSLERMVAPDPAHTDRAVWVRLLDKVELKDDYTVALQLKQPLFEMMLGIDAPSGAGATVPKKYFEAKGLDGFLKAPIGSGPWKIVKWEPSIRLELEANEDYWGTVPKVKKITLLNVTDEATRVAMLKTGELDLAEVAPDSVSSLKSAGLRILSHDGGSQVMTHMWYDTANPKNWAIGNVKVRKALSLGINRKELADKLYAGYAEPSAIMYVRPTAYFWDSNLLKPDPYDPDGAKKLMAEAGYPNGFEAKLWDMGPGVLSSNLVQAILGYWRAIGVKADVAVGDYAAVSPNLKDTFPAAWGQFRFPTHGGGVWNFERVPATYTLTYYGNKYNSELDALIAKVLATKDDAERKKLALQAAVMAKDNLDTIPVVDVRTVFAIGKKVGDFKPILGMSGISAVLNTITIAK
ncbi:MAG: ABC transporter substrate-binding protein [Dehalococcoidia bacterium]|nr:ABC transporter substrate-binding protein [Dehalococcoidia bacterium]